MSEFPSSVEAEQARAELSAGELHLWRVALDVSDARLACLTGSLSPDETERAARYVFEPVQRRFVAARGILRELLGFYSDLPPGALRFTYSPTGRPSLIDAKLPLDFNLSHADDVALYALSLRGPVGVDVESIRAREQTLAAIRRCLADEERAALERESDERQVERLYAWWTCKEALLKASGWGLSVDPVQIVVRFAGDDTARFLCHDPRLAGDSWVARLLDPLAGYVAAVCSRHPPGPIRLRTWGQEPHRPRTSGRAGD